MHGNNTTKNPREECPKDLLFELFVRLSSTVSRRGNSEVSFPDYEERS